MRKEVAVTLKTPVGNFWLDADGRRLTFDVIDVTREVNATDDSFGVERSFILAPHLPEHFKIESLMLKTNLWLSKRNYYDSCSDEFQDGSVWIINDKALQVARYVENEEYDDVVVSMDWQRLPEYAHVDEKYRTRMIFQVTYKAGCPILTT